MDKFRAIATTNEVNLYGHKIPERALIANFNLQWAEAIPSFANHNHEKPIGYTRYDGLFIEPHLIYVLNSLYLPCTDEEQKLVNSFCSQYLYDELVVKKGKDYDYLEEKLKDFVKGPVKKYYTNGAFIYNKGIVKRLFPDLCNKIEDGLIDIKLLQPVLPGIYKFGEFLIYAHKYFRRGYSYLNTLNEPFLNRIGKLKDSTNKVRIAIDLDCIGLASAVRKEYEYAYWGGPKFDDNIENIKLGVTVYNNDKYSSLMSEVRRTEMGWYFQDDIKTFECEELVDVPNILEECNQYYGCRYVHSMVDKDTYKLKHLDGAIRVYDDKKMLNRLEVRMNKTKRDTIYTKIWRIDGTLEVSQWKELIVHYYKDNYLISEYFGGVDNNLQKNRNETKQLVTVRDFIPDNLIGDSGIKCLVSYSQINKLAQDNYIEIFVPTTTKCGNKINNVLEVDALTFIKKLRTKYAKTLVPENTMIICYKDLVTNFPLFICKNVSVANDITELIKEQIYAWWKKKEDRIFSCSLKILYKTKNLRISFAGHVDCFYKYLNGSCFNPLPTDENDFEEWINHTYNALTKLFSKKKDVDPLKLVKDNNLIVIDRKFISFDVLSKIQDYFNGDLEESPLTDEEEAVLEHEKITITEAIIKDKIICPKCGNNYCFCSCIVYGLNETSIKKEDYLGTRLFWTNRKDK